ncbi:iron-sulfur cluster biosynthesis family protein [Mesobacillus foraminis]|uniref:iron-sulfur cluster biosynthesis family protein n=1 Tax=Mesobacillus foraminis TaxID=279826 RepID=UPI000EF4D23F|nr:iron-sulfur cluster biosynthesis family protein [Mesobacillus foraminis]
MEIHITEKAEKKLRAQTEGKQGVYKIVYDTEDCCAVNGIAMLWFVEQPEHTDSKVKTNGLSVFIEKAKEIFFDERLTIDYAEEKGCFQLKSPNQYFNPCMSLIIKS